MEVLANFVLHQTGHFDVQFDYAKCLIFNNYYTFSQEGHQDDSENMQEMDILDMNVLDEADNDNAIPEEEKDEDTDDFHGNDDEVLNDEHDFMAEDDTEDPEVRNDTLGLSSLVLYNCWTGKS